MFKLKPSVSYLTLKERKERSLQDKKKELVVREKRKWELREDPEKYYIETFDDFQHFLKTGRDWYYYDLDIEVTPFPLNYIDLFREEDFKTIVSSNQSKYPFCIREYFYDDDDENWHTKFCDTVVF